MPRFPEQLHLRPSLEPQLYFAERKQQRDYLTWAIETIQLQLFMTLHQAVLVESTSNRLHLFEMLYHVMAIDYELSPYLDTDEIQNKALPSVFIFLDSEEVAKKIETQATSLNLSVKRSHYSRFSTTGYLSAPITLEMTFRNNRHRTVTTF